MDLQCKNRLKQTCSASFLHQSQRCLVSWTRAENWVLCSCQSAWSPLANVRDRNFSLFSPIRLTAAVWTILFAHSYWQLVTSHRPGATQAGEQGISVRHHVPSLLYFASRSRGIRLWLCPLDEISVQYLRKCAGDMHHCVMGMVSTGWLVDFAAVDPSVYCTSKSHLLPPSATGGTFQSGMICLVALAACSNAISLYQSSEVKTPFKGIWGSLSLVSHVEENGMSPVAMSWPRCSSQHFPSRLRNFSTLKYNGFSAWKECEATSVLRTEQAGCGPFAFCLQSTAGPSVLRPVFAQNALLSWHTHSIPSC